MQAIKTEIQDANRSVELRETSGSADNSLWIRYYE